MKIQNVLALQAIKAAMEGGIDPIEYAFAKHCEKDIEKLHQFADAHGYIVTQSEGRATVENGVATDYLVFNMSKLPAKPIEKPKAKKEPKPAKKATKKAKGV